MGYFDIFNLILFGLSDIKTQMAVFGIDDMLLAALVSGAVGGGVSLFGQSQSRKAQEAARRDLQRGQGQAEQIVSRLAHQAEARQGFTPEEMETARFGQRRALEEAMPGARERLLQSLSQRGLLTSGIASRRFQGLERERLRGIAGIEQALQLQNIMQRRSDIEKAMNLRLQQAGILGGGGEQLANISLQGGLAQAQGTQSFANQLLGMGGTLAGQGLAPKTPGIFEQIAALDPNSQQFKMAQKFLGIGTP